MHDMPLIILQEQKTPACNSHSTTISVSEPAACLGLVESATNGFGGSSPLVLSMKAEQPLIVNTSCSQLCFYRQRFH